MDKKNDFSSLGVVVLLVIALLVVGIAVNGTIKLFTEVPITGWLFIIFILSPLIYIYKKERRV